MVRHGERRSAMVIMVCVFSLTVTLQVRYSAFSPYFIKTSKPVFLLN